MPANRARVPRQGCSRSGVSRCGSLRTKARWVLPTPGPGTPAAPPRPLQSRKAMQGQEEAESAPPSSYCFSFPGPWRLRRSAGLEPGEGWLRSAPLTPPADPPLGRGQNELPGLRPSSGSPGSRVVARVLGPWPPVLSSRSPGIFSRGFSTQTCGSSPRNSCGSWPGSNGRLGPPGREMLEPIQGRGGAPGLWKPTGGRGRGDARVCPAEAGTRALLPGLANNTLFHPKGWAVEPRQAAY